MTAFGIQFTHDYTMGFQMGSVFGTILGLASASLIFWISTRK